MRIILNVTVPKCEVNVDNINGAWYIVISDRVTDTCEACNLRRLLRESFLIISAEEFHMGVNSNNGKPFLTYDQQIEKLVKDKGLIINDLDYAKKLLKRYGYFSLISGYKQPFKYKSGLYKKNTSINDILALFNFDNKIRSIILNGTLMVENHIKSLISYSFCEINGDEQKEYLDATKYNYIPANQAGINELVCRLSVIINDSKKYRYIAHQKQYYNNIPLWAIMKALTLGSVSKMYSFLPQNIQSKVAMEFEHVNENDLERMLDLLSRVRNVCAHNERLYDYRYYKGAINDTFIHSNLKLKKTNGQFVIGKSDLFAVLISLKYLVDDQKFQEIADNINDCIKALFNDTHQIQRLQLYKYMGFPDNWFVIKNCPIS